MQSYFTLTFSIPMQFFSLIVKIQYSMFIWKYKTLLFEVLMLGKRQSPSPVNYILWYWWASSVTCYSADCLRRAIKKAQNFSRQLGYQNYITRHSIGDLLLISMNKTVSIVRVRDYHQTVVRSKDRGKMWLDNSPWISSWILIFFSFLVQMNHRKKSRKLLVIVFWFDD